MHSYKSYKICLLFLIFILTTALSSCQKSDYDSTAVTGPTPAATVTTQVIVTVTNTSGAALQDVEISIGTKMVNTDNRGHAVFEDITVNASRFVVKSEKLGYVSVVKGVGITSGTSAYYIKFILPGIPSPVAFSSSAGGTVNLNNGASVVFSPGSFADAAGNPYSGIVQVLGIHYSVDDPNFEVLAPGGDFTGIKSDGSNVALASFGMANIRLRDPAGNPLNLLSGSTAQITFPIAASQQASAPGSIPLWYLDETTALWKEDGAATKQGNTYVGVVSHFSTWNCDYPGPRATITGKVIDCSGNPVAGVAVTLNGFLNLTTNSAGVYSGWVPANWPVNYQVLAQYNPGVSTNSYIVTFTATAGANNIIPDLIINCLTRINGQILSCAGNPQTAWVEFIQNNNSTIYYLPSGVVDVIVPYLNSSSVSFFISPFIFFDTTITVIGGPPVTHNFGNITLCDSIINQTANSFVLNGGNFVNEQVVMVPDVRTANYDFTYQKLLLHTSGLFEPLQDSVYYTFDLNIANFVNVGLYPITNNSGSTLYFHSNRFDLILQNPTDTLFYTVATFGPVGSVVQCTFYGNMVCYDYNSSTFFPVTVSGGYLSYYRSN
ncbi:MAG TPA: carboxypeptidase-like regulatory domain-containing protein [Bacteroidia bacterium]|nr:carboxypeptidase-like regulatory domain-containing protein [Bacteroidia bacterium]